MFQFLKIVATAVAIAAGQKILEEIMDENPSDDTEG